jgi:hypothetical protein
MNNYYLNLLKRITELDKTISFFIKNKEGIEITFDNLYINFTFSNAISLQVDINNHLNYRLFDPFSQVNNSYKTQSGWTYWSMEEIR